MKYIILGTAGHIDHGKSSLVKALTNIDPDRWKEEKERGITLDLGFASLDLPGGNRLGIIDVPGHEGLIKNMLAGVGGIDIVMLVIAADEGIMPQTREHLAICDLLRIKHGVIALTKIDLVEQDWLDLVTDEIREFVKGSFLRDAPVIPVSSTTGDNLPLLIRELDELAKNVLPKSSKGILRLPIDRVFTMKGFGTVVTGTLLTGTINVDQDIDILPKGIRTKVRGLQTHSQTVQQAVAGQRTAVNLQSVEKDDLTRGDTIVSRDYFSSTTTADAALSLLEDSPRKLKTGSRIRLYNTTQEAIGRITLLGKDELLPGQSAYVQFRLERPVVLQHGDRFILRFYSPLETLGGGVILDAHPLRRRPGNRTERLRNLEVLEKGTLEETVALLIANRGLTGIEEHEIIGAIAEDKQAIASALSAVTGKRLLLRAGNLYVHRSHLDQLEKKIVACVGAFHKAHPLKPGLDKEELKGILKTRLNQKILNLAVEGLVKKNHVASEGTYLKEPSFKAGIGKDQQALKEKIAAAIHQGGTQPPLREELPTVLGITDKDAKDLLTLLAREGRTVRINDSLHLDKDVLRTVQENLKKHLEQSKEITVAEFRDLTKTSRKFAVPILEYFDTQKITQRVGDKRVLR